MDLMGTPGETDRKRRRPITRLQYGAVPYRKTASGDYEVLLITSRETKRWIVPKGWPIRGLTPPKSAAREAFEEAGVHGRISTKSLGSYIYDKRLGDQETVRCAVEVFALRFRNQEKTWPEAHLRRTQWYSVADAIATVEEPGLKSLIEAFAGRTPRSKT
jgi:8-oxo-dGTP pyrophosphatase MutT (NUDIX family)